MDRRTALHRIGILMGGTLSASTIAGVLGGCTSGSGTGDMPFKARTLTQGRDELVATLSELIIPETDTPGARAALVHEFIDNMLTDWYDEPEVEEFLTGLTDVERRAQERGEQSFTDLDMDTQVEILTQMEAEAEAMERRWRNRNPTVLSDHKIVNSLRLLYLRSRSHTGIACESHGSLQSRYSV